MLDKINIVTHQLGYFSLIPRFIRLATYKFAILPTSTVFERFLLNRWQNHFSGHSFLGCLGNFSYRRAQKMRDALVELGGKVSWVIPKDGEARLQVVKLSASSLKLKIESLGGVWEKRGDLIIIEGPGYLSTEWDNFYTTVLKKIFKKEISFGNKSVLVTSEHVRDIPFFEGKRKIQCVLLSSFALSFIMEKLEISYFLGKGLDVCLYDTRGILDSEGYPTEGGLYNDIEAVGEYLFYKEGYDPANVCIYGTCGRSFTGIYLYKKYFHKGINMILMNAPGSLDLVISRIHRIAAWLFHLFRDFLQAPFGSKCKNTQEDGFNSMKKLESLDSYNVRSGFVILCKTPGDEIAPSEEVENMGELLQQKNVDVQILENDPKYSMLDNGLMDPHTAHPLRSSDPSIQKTLIEQLTQKKNEKMESVANSPYSIYSEMRDVYQVFSSKEGSY